MFVKMDSVVKVCSGLEVVTSSRWRMFVFSLSMIELTLTQVTPIIAADSTVLLVVSLSPTLPLSPTLSHSFVQDY